MVGGLKHENNTLGIRWYLSTTVITTSHTVVYVYCNEGLMFCFFSASLPLEKET